MKVGKRALYVLVAIVFVLHNAEEGIAAAQMIGFMQSQAPAFLRGLYEGVGVAELRISLAILTLVGVLVTVLCVRRATGAGSSYSMLLFASVIGVNAVMHIALAAAAGAYMPGILTAVTMTLPLAVVLLLRGRREMWVSSGTYWTLLPAALVVHGPVLAAFVRASVTIASMFTGASA
jgi:hypothetical protein